MSSAVYWTSDQLAEAVLQSMLAIEGEYQEGRNVAALRDAAKKLIDGCLRYLSTGPDQFRAEIRPLLPLTQLELDLLNASDSPVDHVVTDDLVERFGEWITRSPMLVDQRAVHVADFLQRLRPSLGLWDDRKAAEALIDRSQHPLWARTSAD